METSEKSSVTRTNLCGAFGNEQALRRERGKGHFHHPSLLSLQPVWLWGFLPHSTTGMLYLVPASENNAVLLSEGKCSIVFACNPCVEDIWTVVWLWGSIVLCSVCKDQGPAGFKWEPVTVKAISRAGQPEARELTPEGHCGVMLLFSPTHLTRYQRGGSLCKVWAFSPRSRLGMGMGS